MSLPKGIWIPVPENYNAGLAEVTPLIAVQSAIRRYARGLKWGNMHDSLGDMADSARLIDLEAMQKRPANVLLGYRCPEDEATAEGYNAALKDTAVPRKEAGL